MAVDRILISGGAGFIGSYTALNLLRQGKQVTLLDNFLPQIHGESPARSITFAKLKGTGVRVIEGDVRDASRWDEALAGQDAIIHLAAETGTGQSMYEIAHYSAVNVQGTAIMLDRLANVKHAVQSMVIASSRSIYGEGKYICAKDGVVYPDARSAEDMKVGDFSVKCPVCGERAEVRATDEDALLKPASVYAVSKAAQEQLMLVVGKSLSVKTTALRYQNVYGPGQSLINPYTGILSIFSGLLLSGGEINIFEDGEEMRDFVFVEDVAEANVRAVMSDKTDGQIINIGTGIGTSVNTVVAELTRAYGAKSKSRVSGDFRLGDIRHNFAAIDRMRDQLGLEPRIDFRQGIDLFADWVKSQGDQLDTVNDRYQESLRKLREKKLMS